MVYKNVRNTDRIIDVLKIEWRVVGNLESYPL